MLQATLLASTAMELIRDLKPGATVDALMLLREKTVRTARTGNAYFDLLLADATGMTIVARMFDIPNPPPAVNTGDLVQVAGWVEVYQGEPQLKLTSIRRYEDQAEAAAFLPR